MESTNKFERIYKVKGMHCASCEILLEKKMIEISGVTSAEASLRREEVRVTYTSGRPTKEQLNSLFKEEGYKFFDEPFKEEKKTGGWKNLWPALIIILGFLYLNRLGFVSAFNVNSSSSLAGFFLFGIIAGLSTCAALVGGLVLSMSKQWTELYAPTSNLKTKMQPHLMFNVGRLLAYGLGGGLLGLVGEKLKFSSSSSSFLAVLVALLMLVLGLQMLGVRYFQKWQIRMPRFITRHVADEKKFSGKQMPFILGALTFFLPCGFTITSQGAALLAGSFWQGSLIMLFFALGTSPILLLIGLSSVKYAARPNMAGKFLKTAGFLVVFFALFNLNAQFNVLGWPSVTDWFKSSSSTQQVVEDGLPPLINGVQVLKMEASSLGYTPDHLKVRVGVPVRWEVTDTGTSGCTNAIIARGLFAGQIDLINGQISVKEFTPTKIGRYKFSCWMGMVNGIIDVVE
ncbi:MAG: sulfite exporter TauE/SafE family protein [Candidatus Magasanikbacteria bacterium]|nr:sulfite exporter TauE/SafE family protein [Candidatus Magasanikbacteria bacterium]